MNSIEKRKATILKKRENKLIRQQIYKKKQELKGDYYFFPWQSSGCMDYFFAP